MAGYNFWLVYKYTLKLYTHDMIKKKVKLLGFGDVSYIRTKTDYHKN